jgi:hypothetical protein
MSTRSVKILMTVLLLVGGASGFLTRWKTIQKLGQPGVKVVAEPIYDEKGNRAATNSAFLPERVLDYSSEPVPITRLELDWLPKDTTYGRRHYRSPDGFEMLISVVLMGADRTSIHKPQYCLPGQGWNINSSESGITSARIERPQPYDLPVMKLVTTVYRDEPDGQKTVVRGIYVYWFVADGELTADHVQRMWWMARDLVYTGTLQRWAYVGCFATCLPGQEEPTFVRMKQFIAAAVPEFQLASGPVATEAPLSAVVR